MAKLRSRSARLCLIAIAQRYQVHVLGIEKNPDSVAQARKNIRAAGVEDKVTIIEGDILQLDKIPDKFDYVLGEAILTMQSEPGKAKILSSIKNLLKPEGKVLSHEMLVCANESAVRKNLSQSIRVNANPLTLSQWQSAYQTAGLTLQQWQTGEMGLLNFRQILRDEKLLGTIKIFWNTLTNANLRQRILKMRRSFQQNRQNIGYIVSWAKLS